MADSTQNQLSGQIISGGSPDGWRKHFTRRKVMIIGGVLLIIFGVIGVLAGMYIQSQAQKEDDELFRATEARVNSLRAQKKYQESIKEADAYIAVGKNQLNVITMMTSKGATYEIMKDNKAALAAYRQAETKAGKDMYGIDSGIARTSRVLGDNKTALIYYKKCIAILEKGEKSGAKAMEVDYLKRTVKSMEESGAAQ